MFAIYTPNGRTFSGPLETLRQIEQPQATNATRKHQDINDSQSFSEKNFTVTPKAIDAYRKTIKQPQQNKEPIYHAYQVMTTHVHALSANSSLKTTIGQFQQHPFHEFPIIDSNYQLIGRLSRHQL
ncbi:MAG: CBS-domain-containing membrane protein [Phenylobacterium sp.]|jgi:CBS-domain-containing membrane protein